MWMTGAILVVLLAVFISILRITLPYLEGQKNQIADWISEQYGTKVEIGHIDAGWHGVGPVLLVKDIRLINSPQSPIRLSIDETQIDVDFWASIKARQLVSKRFNLVGLNLDVNADQTSGAGSDFPIVNALRNLFLVQLQRFSVVDSEVVVTRKQRRQTIAIQRLGWVNKGQRHQGVGQLRVADLTRNSASFVLDLFGDEDKLNGTFYADGQDLDLSPWLQQLLPGDGAIQQNKVNFTLWADIQESKIVDVLWQLKNSHFGWDDDNQTFVNVNAGVIHAKPHLNGWLFNVDQLDYSTNGFDNLLVDASAFLDENRHLTLNLSHVPIAPLLPVAAVLTSQKLNQAVKDFDPQGLITSATLFFDGQGIKTSAHLDDLSLQSSGQVPGFDNVSADLNWQYDQGTIALLAEQGQLNTEALLGHPLAYQKISANIRLDEQADGINISMPGLSFVSDELNFDLQLSYSNDNLQVATRVQALSIAQAKQLFPEELMGKNTYSYLNRALVSGQVSYANIIWNGNPSHYPFADNSGVFQAYVAISDSEFDFDEEWPNLQQLNLNLLFENEGLEIDSQQGHLLNIPMTSMHASIPELASDGVLSINIDATASGEDLSQLMLKGGLADSVGSALQEVQISGDLSSKIKLVIPFDDEPVVASGDVMLANNPVRFDSIDTIFDGVTGKLHFVNDHISAENLDAHYATQSMQLTLDGKDQVSGYLTNIRLAGHWDLNQVLKTYYPGLGEYVAGIADWKANLDLTIPAQGFDYTFSLNSDLPRVSSDLPAPFNKTTQMSMPLNIRVKGDQVASTVNLKLGSQVSFEGILPHKEKRFSRAHLAMGKEPGYGLGAGFSISADLMQMDFDNWYQSLHHLITQAPQFEGESVLGQPERIFVNASEMQALGQQFHQVSGVIKLLPENWQIDVSAKELKAQVNIDHDWLGKGIDIKADYINLDQWQAKEGQNKDKQLDITEFPPISFVCSRCRYQQYDLGKVELNLSRISGGMRIDKLNLQHDESMVVAHGNWLMKQGVETTSLSGKFNSDDFGALLKSFKMNSGVRDSNANFDFALNWQGAPHQFNFGSLNGNVDWKLGDGYLTEVSDKGARLFSILSLDSLVRKLRLDFRDVFAKGFFYDKMTGTFQVNNGRVNTNDTYIDGAAGEMQLKGYTDLPTKGLNYKISFTPKVTSSLPVIVAWMVNPATAIAALALDEVISSAKVVSSIDFSLTGTIDEPQLKEIGRDSREIMLPAKNVPQQPQVPDEPADDLLPPPMPESQAEDAPTAEGVG
nr:YhdP family protein [Neptunicella marina]